MSQQPQLKQDNFIAYLKSIRPTHGGAGAWNKVLEAIIEKCDFDAGFYVVVSLEKKNNLKIKELSMVNLPEDYPEEYQKIRNEENLTDVLFAASRHYSDVYSIQQLYEDEEIRERYNLTTSYTESPYYQKFHKNIGLIDGTTYGGDSPNDQSPFPLLHHFTFLLYDNSQNSKDRKQTNIDRLRITPDDREKVKIYVDAIKPLGYVGTDIDGEPFPISWNLDLLDNPVETIIKIAIDNLVKLLKDSPLSILGQERLDRIEEELLNAAARSSNKTEEIYNQFLEDLVDMFSQSIRENTEQDVAALERLTESTRDDIGLRLKNFTGQMLSHVVGELTKEAVLVSAEEVNRVYYEPPFYLGKKLSQLTSEELKWFRMRLGMPQYINGIRHAPIPTPEQIPESWLYKKRPKGQNALDWIINPKTWGQWLKAGGAQDDILFQDQLQLLCQDGLAGIKNYINNRKKRTPSCSDKLSTIVPPKTVREEQESIRLSSRQGITIKEDATRISGRDQMANARKKK